MTLYIRLEKLRFLVTEMRLALRLAQFAPTDADARMIARHILIVTNGAIVIHTQRLKSDPGGNLLS